MTIYIVLLPQCLEHGREKKNDAPSFEVISKEVFQIIEKIITSYEAQNTSAPSNSAPWRVM